MFTDSPATPARLETLLEVLLHFKGGLTREQIYGLLQPQSLSGGNNQATIATLSAALQLGLVNDNKSIIMSKKYKVRSSPKTNILLAIDKVVLSSTEIEYHLALYYSYVLGLNERIYAKENSREDWVNDFNHRVLKDDLGTNPFNTTKHTGLHRWMSYIGLGWHDSGDLFLPDPYERLLRKLPEVFSGKKQLSGSEFMERLAVSCPELDGGEIFLNANEYLNYSKDAKQCSLGLSQALVALHEDQKIRLNCPKDSRGWFITLANPPRGDSIQSDRITTIEILK